MVDKSVFKRAGLLMALAGGGLLATGAVAQAYPPLEPAVSVDDPTPDPSGPVIATVTGCQPGETVEFELVDSTDTDTCVEVNGAGFAQVAVADGTATGDLEAPASPGTYQGTAELLTTEATLPFQIVVEAGVTPPPTPTTPVTLPSTGGESGQMVPLAVGLLAAGAGLLAVASFRRRHAEA
ncbi:LPXTG-motif cell wall-anchored protein [Ilumatobacter fluminis]|uniref:LPXTG-motif cell wall-anchored protein n=1 Tax=Ilumatobacter fluminis TaxID=467091 RepID=A0A4R7HX73_9ACTN|nr:LPXTG cell wall anchor domain-containing protein [Ilumatobacter fluminis]TDT15625.1 LPXTG-motif cell wall-anchored protein [Ilumatobacter fluminis]